MPQGFFSFLLVCLHQVVFKSSRLAVCLLIHATDHEIKGIKTCKVGPVINGVMGPLYKGRVFFTLVTHLIRPFMVVLTPCLTGKDPPGGIFPTKEYVTSQNVSSGVACLAKSASQVQ